MRIDVFSYEETIGRRPEYYLSSTSPSSPWLRSSILILTDATSHFSVLFRASGAGGSKMPTDRMPSILHSFGSSLENFTRLTLGNVTIHFLTLGMFVSHFPRLDNLSISAIRTLDSTGDLYPAFRGEIVPTHPRGKFSVSSLSTYQVPKGVFEAITLEPRFHQVSGTRWLLCVA